MNRVNSTNIRDGRSDIPTMKTNGIGGAVDTTPPENTAIPTPTYFAFWSTSPTSYPIFSHSLICSIVLLLSATRTLPIVQSVVQPFLSTLSLFLLRVTFISTAALSVLHQTGALRRYVLKFAEDELKKNLNGALITISDAQVDLWRGKVVVQVSRIYIPTKRNHF